MNDFEQWLVAREIDNYAQPDSTRTAQIEDGPIQPGSYIDYKIVLTDTATGETHEVHANQFDKALDIARIWVSGATPAALR